MAKIGEKFSVLNSQRRDPRTRMYVTPQKVLMTQGDVSNVASLLRDKPNQITLEGTLEDTCVLRNAPDSPHAAVLLDFGIEFSGSVRLFTWGVRSSGKDRADVLVRTGESAMEALTTLGEKNALNDHAIRDRVLNLGRISETETTETGFRFLYIELLDEEAEIEFQATQGVCKFLDLDYIGTFESDNAKLNQIWNTAAYTTHMNMQEYLLDGIKRDRLVWGGDLHVEMHTIMAVFGEVDIVSRSLDLLRNTTPTGNWINGISTYSLWWILEHYDWYRHYGDRNYLNEQRTYMRFLLESLLTYVDENGKEILPEWRFLDWPNSDNPEAIHAGLQALMVMALERGGELMEILEEHEIAVRCKSTSEKMRACKASPNGSKTAAAFLALSGMEDAKAMNKIIAQGGAKKFSAFSSLYLLTAMAEAGNIDGAIKCLLDYYGGMLDMGATTFWEDFSVDWTKNAARIDEITPNGKEDIHGDFGEYCYKNFRRSLCHGWSSGPCPWISKYILGVEVLSPRVVRVVPNLGKLKRVQGSYPTPYGPIRVAHSLREDGTVGSQIIAPSELTVIRK